MGKPQIRETEAQAQEHSFDKTLFLGLSQVCVG